MNVLKIFRGARPGLGDITEGMAKPIARAFKLECLDKNGSLKPGSPCAKRKALLNKIVPPSSGGQKP